MSGMRLMELLIYAARCLRQNDPYPVPAMLQTEKYLKVQEIAVTSAKTTAAQGRWRKSPAGFLSANPI